jgi:hypothetical protein
MSLKPVANVTEEWQDQRVKVSHTEYRFNISYGYKGRSHMQMRLDRNDKIWLSIDGDYRRDCQASELRGFQAPLEVVVKCWDDFLDSVEAGIVLAGHPKPIQPDYGFVRITKVEYDELKRKSLRYEQMMEIGVARD